MNYKIKGLNNDKEIVNPEIIIIDLDIRNPNVSNIDFLKMIYSIEIVLISNGVEFPHILDKVQADPINTLMGQDVRKQVLNRLEDFEI